MSRVTPLKGRSQPCCVVCHRLQCEQPRLGILPYHGNGRENSQAWYRDEDAKVERTESKITAQGQVSVPVRIRRRLGLTPGSKIEWCEVGDDVIVRRASKYSSQDIHEAVFDTPPQRRSVADMDEGIRSRARRTHARG